MDAACIREALLPDALNGVDVRALCLKSGLLEVVCVPERALDIYELRYAGTRINPLNPGAGISPASFQEDGARGFARNFFVGMLTTCGLIQAGRPCEEDGRAFGLHGRISNTPARQVEGGVRMDEAFAEGVAVEAYPEGEQMELRRRISVNREGEFSVCDVIRNAGTVPAPLMLMYHINFGAPFLSEALEIELPASYVEERAAGARDGRCATAVHARGAFAAEKVFYTRTDLRAGATLTNPKLKLRCQIRAEGDALDWTGIWQNYTREGYALGIEPGNCPGLGRVNARRRGLLQWLEPGEARSFCVRLRFSRLP